ncbi:MAG: 5'-3'-deoxyribonucleotidase [Nanoarchaeota archaeon]|nr:5'-3'-deoxyribonucleotidase [Nanoarchaeota archaeon]
MRILVDMDDVLAETCKKFEEIWKEKHPDLICIPAEQQPFYYFTDCYPKEYAPLIEEIRMSKGIFLSLKPTEGGLEAITEMKSKGHEVFICSSPLTGHETCASEKYQWVRHYLGKEWEKKTLLVPDKTVVSGNILIDDKPEITGIAVPSWEHIFYDRPYNRHITNKRRLTWDNWREVLKL